MACWDTYRYRNPGSRTILCAGSCPGPHYQHRYTGTRRPETVGPGPYRTDPPSCDTRSRTPRVPPPQFRRIRWQWGRERRTWPRAWPAPWPFWSLWGRRCGGSWYRNRYNGQPETGLGFLNVFPLRDSNPLESYNYLFLPWIILTWPYLIKPKNNIREIER